MANINLLPQAIALKGRDKVLIGVLGKVATIGFIVLIVVGLAIGGYFVYTAIRIKASLSEEEVLKVEVTSLSQTEQSYFLIKDRISKIRSVLALESANGQIETLATLPIFTGEAQVLEVQFTAQKVTLGLVFPSSTAFGAFYKGLIESGVYKTVILKAFSFSPSVGYIATLELSGAASNK